MRSKGLKGTVLLATDDKRSRDKMVNLLRKNSYATDVVNGCAALLEHLFRTDYDVVIVDSDLKEMTGLDVLNFVKSIRSAKETFVVMTDDTSQEVRQKVAQMGAYFMLGKPLQQDFTNQLIRSFEKRLSRLKLGGKDGDDVGPYSLLDNK